MRRTHTRTPRAAKPSNSTGTCPSCTARSLHGSSRGRVGHYLDGTVGAGGHAQGLLEASSPSGRLLGLDRDAEAVRCAGERLAPLGRARSFGEHRSAN